MTTKRKPGRPRVSDVRFTVGLTREAYELLVAYAMEQRWTKGRAARHLLAGALAQAHPGIATKGAHSETQ